jgi:hypothetical protein
MNTKDEVFSQFQDFMAQVENQIGKKIKVLRLNNGEEYTSNDASISTRRKGSRGSLQSHTTLKKMWLYRERIISLFVLSGI